MEFFKWLADLPPFSWLVNFFVLLSDIPPFSWLVNLVGWLGHQIGSAMWLWDQVTWKWVWLGILAIAIIEFFWWGIMVWRAKEVDYDPHKCSHHENGEPREHPIKLDKALYRRFSWPKLGLPLIAVATVMFTIQLVSFSHTTYAVLAILWFVSAPVRVAMGLAIARQVYHQSNPDKRLATSFWRDFQGYYGAGLSLTPPSRGGKQRRVPQPPFLGKTWATRLANLAWKFGRRLGHFWQIWRLFSFLRFWKLLGHLITSWAWPITAVIAPFYYMEHVEELQHWWQPWWRAYRHNSHSTQFIEGETVAVHDVPVTR